jgi:hypothetical protein
MSFGCRRPFAKTAPSPPAGCKTGEPVYWLAPAPLRTILKNAHGADLAKKMSGVEGVRPRDEQAAN